jgi:hypothetical protein
MKDQTGTGLGQAAAMLFAGLFLNACAATALYRPQSSGRGTGYSDQQITLTRYRVSSSGDPDTSRAQVEDYLMRRAAELTVKAGYNHFTFDNRSTEASSVTSVPPDSWNPDNGLTFSLGRRYQPKNKDYFGSWSFPAYLNPSDTMPVVRYTARSEIVLLTAEQAARTPGALSAREIFAHLAPAEAQSAAAGPSGRVTR